MARRTLEIRDGRLAVKLPPWVRMSAPERPETVSRWLWYHIGTAEPLRALHAALAALRAVTTDAPGLTAALADAEAWPALGAVQRAALLDELEAAVEWAGRGRAQARAAAGLWWEEGEGAAAVDADQFDAWRTAARAAGFENVSEWLAYLADDEVRARERREVER